MQPRHDVVKAGYVRYELLLCLQMYVFKPYAAHPTIPHIRSSSQSSRCRVRRSRSPCDHNQSGRADASADYAITHNLTPFISMQNHYSLMYREEEREMFPTLNMFGVGSIPWSPFACGLLRRPNAASSKGGDTDPYVHPPFPRCLPLRLFLTRPRPECARIRPDKTPLWQFVITVLPYQDPINCVRLSCYQAQIVKEFQVIQVSLYSF